MHGFMGSSQHAAGDTLLRLVPQRRGDGGDEARLL